MAIPLDERVAKFIIWTLYFVGLYFSLFWLSVFLLKPEPNTRKKYETWPSVTIILPMWNEEDTAEWTLKSVYALDYPKDKLNVICVNDGSTDGTLKLLKKLKKKWNFRIIDKPNGGKHTALNEGLKYANTEFFACLDADSYADKKSLKNLIEEFDTDEVAAVMPIMRVYRPQNVLQRVQWLEYTMNIFIKHMMGKLDSIHVTPGPLSVYRTKYVKQVGGFNKAHNTEDLEMALKLQDRHYKLKQSLDAVVYTKSPKTTKAFIAQRTRWYKGTLLNVKDYRHFLLNRKYGDFGFYHMPMVAITGILTLLGIMTMIYLFAKETYHTIKRWYLTNFDFWTYITNYHWNKSLLDFDWQIIFLTSIIFFLIFVTLYLSFSATQERTNVFRRIKYFFMFLYYFFIYKFVMGWIWLKVLYSIAFNKANKWTKVN